MLWQLFALEFNRLTPLQRQLVRVAFLIAIFVFAWTAWENYARPGDDLRNRVVGARVMLAGADPYTFVWQPGMPEELLDPVHDPHAHRLTVSPPTLFLYAPIAPLPWRLVRLVSFLAEWLALAGSLILLARSVPDSRMRMFFLLGAVLFVIATDVWRLHLERGQVYVFQLLALSAAIHLSRRGEVDSIAAGIALGLLALMRPNLLVIAPALLLARRWRCGAAMLGTFGIGAAATLAVLPMSSWRSYLSVGDQYYRAIQGEPIVSMPRPAHDGPVEGTEFAGEHSLKNIESSSFPALWSKLHENADLPMIDLALVSKAILAILAAILLVLAWRRRRRRAAGGVRADRRLEPGYGILLAAPLGLRRRDAAGPAGAGVAEVASAEAGEPASARPGAARPDRRHTRAALLRPLRGDVAALVAGDGRLDAAGPGG